METHQLAPMDESFFQALGNFLSGMETRASLGRRLIVTSLGNFLSGMETFFGRRGGGAFCPLETSLVEWKRRSSPML